MGVPDVLDKGNEMVRVVIRVVGNNHVDEWRGRAQKGKTHGQQARGVEWVRVGGGRTSVSMGWERIGQHRLTPIVIVSPHPCSHSSSPADPPHLGEPHCPTTRPESPTLGPVQQEPSPTGARGIGGSTARAGGEAGVRERMVGEEGKRVMVWQGREGRWGKGLVV